mgnify:CR=1 FL=1
MSTQRNIVIARSVIDQGLTTTQAAEKFGISRQWVHVLVTRYRAGGSQAMHPGSKAPRRSPQRIPPPLRERIITLRTELTAQGADAGPETIAWHLHQEGLRVPSTSTIRRILHAEALIQPAPRKRPKSSYLRFEADLPNSCWQSDFTHTALTPPAPPAPATPPRPSAQAWREHDVEIITWLDDYSRMALHISAHQRITGAIVVETFTATTKIYGPPASTLTDNGLVYTARYRGGVNAFEKLLRSRSIEQRNGRGGHPQTQGKVERFQQTLKKWLAAQPPPADLPGLQALLDQFREIYNTQRIHSAKKTTPYAAYIAAPKDTPGPLAPATTRFRTDKIDATGKVTLRYDGQLFHIGIGRAHARTHVVLIVEDREITIVAKATGEILRELTLDPTRKYQPQRKTPRT